MRGKAELVQAYQIERRITPACAGKSRFPSSKAPSRRDHPRVCREKWCFVEVGHIKEGSPPRMRGKEGLALGADPRPGITPAYAGKSIDNRRNFIFIRDHPRVCGEKKPPPGDKSGEGGSPPRMRGKGCTLNRGKLETGITPACAGKRSPARMKKILKQDHPRVCGEKTLILAVSFVGLGSPPRVRGKVHFCFCGSHCVGITPACAGKSAVMLCQTPDRKDHPRVCGEKSPVMEWFS